MDKIGSLNENGDNRDQMFMKTYAYRNEVVVPNWKSIVAHSDGIDEDWPMLLLISVRFSKWPKLLVKYRKCFSTIAVARSVDEM